MNTNTNPNTDKIVLVTLRDTYGMPRIYPENENAELFAALVNRKTLTWHDLKYIEKLGYTVTETVRSDSPLKLRRWMQEI